MNKRMINYILGKMLGVEAALMLIPAIVGLIYQEASVKYFFLTMVILGLIFFLAGRKKPENTTIYAKEGLVIVSMAWILWSVFGAVPYYVSGYIPNFLDAFFESVSGFTTTGSTILVNIEALPKCMHFWRNFTQWIGGMGVLVFVMVLTTLDKKNSMHLMRAEVPGPEKDKLLPKMKSTAQILYAMYFALTVILVILLKMGGMNLFDSFIHAFGTAGTGGFSNYTLSVGYFNSAYIEWILTIFMILFGINFNLYFFLLMKEWKLFYKNEELKIYFGIFVTATALISVNIYEYFGNLGDVIRHAAFQVAAMITSTGYVTTDYNLWPMFSKNILLALMICGACASSTGGGVKVSRVMIVVKSIKKEIKQMLHPKSVNVVRVNGKKVGNDTIHSVYIYFLSYIVIVVGSVLIVSLDNYDFATTFSAVLAAISNLGMGIEQVGPAGGFIGFSPLSKLVLCLNMLAGRLEIFPFLMLVSLVWRKKF